MSARILITNDDGIDAPGIIAVIEELNGTVAPSTEQSGKSAALTVRGHLEAKRHTYPGSISNVVAWSVDGTPVDCVLLHRELGVWDTLPDLVISGINKGLNTGLNVQFSGTMGAAICSRILEVNTLALSLDYLGFQEIGFNYNFAARKTVELIREILGNHGQHKILVNANFPNVAKEEEIKGFKHTKQGWGHWKGCFTPAEGVESNSEKKVFAITGFTPVEDNDDEIDIVAVRKHNWISLTPVTLHNDTAMFEAYTESEKIFSTWSLFQGQK